MRGNSFLAIIRKHKHIYLLTLQFFHVLFSMLSQVTCVARDRRCQIVKTIDVPIEPVDAYDVNVVRSRGTCIVRVGAC